MYQPHILHIFSPSNQVSPFDVNMAYEAEFDIVVPYPLVGLGDIYAMTQDTIFSRSRAGIKKTYIFIGGRAFDVAIDMLEQAKKAMVPPFAVSVFADPSGSITTAAAIIACIEAQLKNTGDSLEGKKIHIIGGTGPVGLCAGVLAENCGADVFLLSHRGLKVAEEFTMLQNKKFNVQMRGVDMSTDASLVSVLQSTDIIINSAKAGMQMINKEKLQKANKLLIAADINAVPPLGIEGIASHDNGKTLEDTPNNTLGIGALAIGNVKYKVHCQILEIMKKSEKPLYLNHEDALKVAREHVAK